jgi:hypothetical protein
MSHKTQPAQPISSADYLKIMREKRSQRQKNTSPEAPLKREEKETPKTQKKEKLFPGVPKPRPKKTIVTWIAPSRPFKKRDRQYYTTVAAIVFLVSLILFFAGQFLPIAVVISIGFLAYVLSSVPPHEVKIEINTYGIEIEELPYYWEEMGRFWLEQKYGQEILTIEVVRFPGRIILMFKEDKKEELRKILSEVLLEEKPIDTFYDKAGKWLQDKIPLELNS